MTELKCPFCNKKLEPIGTSGQFQCGTWGCDASFNFIATRDVWEYIDRTRKKLDIAVDALFDIHKHSYACCAPAGEIGYIHAASYNALEKTCKEFEQINQKKEI